MSIFSDAWNWAGGAVDSVGDWFGGAWDSLSGQSDYRATPYASDLSAAYGPLEQLAQQQALTGQQMGAQMGAYGQHMLQQGQSGSATQSALAQAAQQAGQASAARQWGIGDNMSALGQAAAAQFGGLGAQASGLGQGYAADMGGIGSNLAQTGANFGGQQSGLAASLLSGPSVAQLQGNAAAQRADQEIAARIAGARGANTNLMVRDAIQSGQMQRANLSSDLAAAAAAENVARQQAASGILGAAAQSTMAGQQGQLGAQQAAAQTALAGNAQAGQQYGQGFAAGLGGQQGQLAATQGATTAQMTGLGQAAAGEQAANDIRFQGYQGGLGAATAAAQATMGGQAAASDTAGKAATIRMGQEQINSGSWDSTNATNAGIEKSNAAGEQGVVGGLVKGGATAMMMSDIRAKTDVKPVDPYGLEAFRTDTSALPLKATPQSKRVQDPNTGNPWEDVGSMLGQYLASSDKPEATQDQTDILMSDERSKEDKRSLLSLLSSEGNRENLEPIEPSSYRYTDEAAAEFGEDTGPRIGIMAGDIEDAPAGESVVMTDPETGYKGLDQKRALSFALAAAAGLDKRVKELETEGGAPSKTRSKRSK